MKVLRVTSDYVDVPLLEVRTDGNKIEIIVDNSNGKISKELDDTLASLHDYVKHSSHLKLTEPDEPAAHLLRYVLENGDVAEVTTDGATCVLNNKLLSRQEKAAFFDALSSGQIKVARKADIQTPIPVPAGTKRQPQPNEPKKVKLDMHILEQYNDQQREKKKKQEDQALRGEADFGDATFEIPSTDIPFAQSIAQVIAKDKYANK
jgi:hypothetical protein